MLLIPPWVLTALNLWNLFAECSGKRKLAPRSFAGLSLGIGAVEYFLLLCAEFDYSGKDYDQATYAFQTHNLIDSAHALSFWLPFLVGVVGLVLLLWCRPEQLSPLVSAGAVAGVLVGNIMQILLAVQIAEQVDLHRFLDWYFYLYHGNLLLLSAMGDPPAHRRTDKDLTGTADGIPAGLAASAVSVFGKDITFSAGCLFAGAAPCGSVGSGTDSLRTGRGRHSSGVYPDGGLDIFTAASAASFGISGTLSLYSRCRRTPELGASASSGASRGAVIVVNRQLAVANAFEELLQERLPCPHRRVRQFYDTHGYPLSQKITTPFRADLVYLLMKPLEWLFVVVLYLFDLAPECRIARQYTAGKPVKNWSEKTYADIRN